jgi:hypothetical protein
VSPALSSSQKNEGETPIRTQREGEEDSGRACRGRQGGKGAPVDTLHQPGTWYTHSLFLSFSLNQSLSPLSSAAFLTDIQWLPEPMSWSPMPLQLVCPAGTDITCGVDILLMYDSLLGSSQTGLPVGWSGGVALRPFSTLTDLSVVAQFWPASHSTSLDPSFASTIPLLATSGQYHLLDSQVELGSNLFRFIVTSGSGLVRAWYNIWLVRESPLNPCILPATNPCQYGSSCVNSASNVTQDARLSCLCMKNMWGPRLRIRPLRQQLHRGALRRRPEPHLAAYQQRRCRVSGAHSRGLRRCANRSCDRGLAFRGHSRANEGGPGHFQKHRAPS